jgi:putative transposase
LWAWLSHVWSDSRSALAIVQPETVIAWHRKGLRLFWVWKIRRGQPGRPALPCEVRDLIRRMCRENPTWGAPRIHGELLKLGIDISESSVSKYMVLCRKPPSQTWRTFLENHAKQLVSIDFFTVPTIRFQVLYVFLVLAHDHRRVLHFHATAPDAPLVPVCSIVAELLVEECAKTSPGTSGTFCIFILAALNQI